MNRKYVVAATVALLIALVSGCSSSGPSTGLAPGVVKLKATDFRFVPASVSRTAGKQVTLAVTNDGKVVHNISLPEIAGVPADLLSIDIQPGHTENLIFIAPADATTLPFFCKFHKDRGMTGSLQLTTGRSATTGAPGTTGAPDTTTGAPDTTTGAPDTTSGGPGPT